MSERFVRGAVLGIQIARLWSQGQARQALDAAHFMVSGCLDAPEEMPAGAWRSYEYGPSEHGIGPVTFRREIA